MCKTCTVQPMAQYLAITLNPYTNFSHKIYAEHIHINLLLQFQVEVNEITLKCKLVR